jgi:hypothetical protein
MVAVYPCLTTDSMLKKVFQRERSKTTWKNPIREAEIAVEEVGHKIELQAGVVWLDGEQMDSNATKVRKVVVEKFKGWWIQTLTKTYEMKVVQSIMWKELRKYPRSFEWMHRNITSNQMARILTIQE